MKNLLTSALGCLVISTMISSLAVAQDETQVEPMQPRFDWFAIQGEYTGDLVIDGYELRIAAHVIALGEDKFRTKVYFGGLPGDGWSGDGDSTSQIDSKIVDGKIIFERDGDRFVVGDGVLTVSGDDKETHGELKRVERTSETLGKAPPEGATILFDGSTGDQFETRDGADPLVDGLLRQGITSKQKFGSCHLHIEFKLPFEPTKTGQARGNSGIYVQGRYEIQMLDSFGLTGEANECGGIYGVSRPDVNMCYPPESWQTYDIDFTTATWSEAGEKTANARMSVRHNGVVIHDNVEIPGPTTAAPLKETAEPGYIYLQNHGSPVRYRNIWLVEK